MDFIEKYNMKILDKLYRNNFREALRPDDRLVFDYVFAAGKIEKYIYRLLECLNEPSCHKDEKEKLIKWLREMVRLIEEIDKIDIKNTLIIKIIDNLKSQHNTSDKGVIYDTSNLKFVAHYRGEGALNETKRLLSKEIRKIPAQLGEFFSHRKGVDEIIKKKFLSISKVRKYMHDKKRICIRLISILEKGFSTADVVKSWHSFKAASNLIDYYLISAIRKVIIEMKLYNAKVKLKGRRKSIFFLFGGMENRYLPIIREMIKGIRKDYRARLKKISSTKFCLKLLDYDIDIYMLVCIGSSSRYYPPYYYTPTAHEISGFIKDNFNKKDILKVALFGICGSFKDKPGALYLPQDFSSLLYSFEKKVAMPDIKKINSRYIRAQNFLRDIINGKKDKRVFTCSTLYNESIIEVSKAEYNKIKGAVEKDRSVPNCSKRKKVKEKLYRYKRDKLSEFSEMIAKKDIADGVEMESFILAKAFPDKLGVYLRVSDNIIEHDKLAFGMQDFTRSLLRDYSRIIEHILESA